MVYQPSHNCYGYGYSHHFQPHQNKHHQNKRATANLNPKNPISHNNLKTKSHSIFPKKTSAQKKPPLKKHHPRSHRPPFPFPSLMDRQTPPSIIRKKVRFPCAGKRERARETERGKWMKKFPATNKQTELQKKSKESEIKEDLMTRRKNKVLKAHPFQRFCFMGQC